MPNLSPCLDELAAIFIRGKQESFEDGMDSRFTRELEGAYQDFGPAIFIPLALLTIRADPYVVEEFLCWIGRIELEDDITTIGCRREILLIGLERDHVGVRDSAVLGIASLNDPFFIPALTTIIKREEFEGLRERAVQVLQQLQKTAQERSKTDEGIPPQ